MNLDQLKIFITVVEYGSFTKAAESMYISHSTTSRNVSALEEELGVKLIARTSRTVAPTSAGLLLYREGQTLIDTADALAKKVRETDENNSSELKILSVNLFSPRVDSFLRRIRTLHPDIEISLSNGGLNEIFYQVDEGNADVGITYSYALPEDMKGFEYGDIARDRFCIIASPKNAIATGRTISKFQLKDVNYVSVGEQRSAFTRKLEEEILTDRPINQILPVTGMESLLVQVRSGNGISLVPYPMACEYCPDCKILDVSDMNTSFGITAFWKKDNKNRAIEMFEEMIEKIK